MPTEGTGFYSVTAPSVGWGEGKEGEEAKHGVAKGEIVPGTSRECDGEETEAGGGKDGSGPRRQMSSLQPRAASVTESSQGHEREN